MVRIKDLINSGGITAIRNSITRTNVNTQYTTDWAPNGDCTPLLHAVRQNNLEIVKYLVSIEADMSYLIDGYPGNDTDVFVLANSFDMKVLLIKLSFIHYIGDSTDHKRVLNTASVLLKELLKYIYNQYKNEVFGCNNVSLDIDQINNISLIFQEILHYHQANRENTKKVFTKIFNIFDSIVNFQNENEIEIGNHRLLFYIKLFPLEAENFIDHNNMLQKYREYQSYRLDAESPIVVGRWTLSLKNQVKESINKQVFTETAELLIKNDLSTTIKQIIDDNRIYIVLGDERVAESKVQLGVAQQEHLTTFTLLEILLSEINKEYKKHAKFNILVAHSGVLEDHLSWNLDIVFVINNVELYEREQIENWYRDISARPKCCVLTLKKTDFFSIFRCVQEYHVIYRTKNTAETQSKELVFSSFLESQDAKILNPLNYYYKKSFILTPNAHRDLFVQILSDEYQVPLDLTDFLSVEELEEVESENSIKIKYHKLLSRNEGINDVNTHIFQKGFEAISQKLNDLESSYETIISEDIPNLQTRLSSLLKKVKDMQYQENYVSKTIENNTLPRLQAAPRVDILPNPLILQEQLLFEFRNLATIKVQEMKTEIQNAMVQQQSGMTKYFLEQKLILENTKSTFGKYNKFLDEESAEAIKELVDSRRIAIEHKQILGESEYNKVFYQSFVQKMHAIYVACSAVQSDILSSQKTAFGCDIGSVIQNLGSNIPMFGLPIYAVGMVISQLDRSYHENMIKNFVRIVNTVVDMDYLAKITAINILKERARLDYQRLNVPTMKERALNVFKGIFEEMDMNVHSARDGAKHASIILSTLINFIYSNALTGNTEEISLKLSSKVLEVYELKSPFPHKIDDSSIEDLVEQIVKKGYEIFEKNHNIQRLISIHPIREAELREGLMDILSRKDASNFNYDTFVEDVANILIEKGVFKITHTQIMRIKRFDIDDGIDSPTARCFLIQKIEILIDKIISSTRSTVSLSTVFNEDHDEFGYDPSMLPVTVSVEDIGVESRIQKIAIQVLHEGQEILMIKNKFVSIRNRNKDIGRENNFIKMMVDILKELNDDRMFKANFILGLAKELIDTEIFETPSRTFSRSKYFKINQTLLSASGFLKILIQKSLNQVSALSLDSGRVSLPKSNIQQNLIGEESCDSSELDGSVHNSASHIYKVEAVYNNSLLNHKQLLNQAYEFAGMKAVNSILDFGDDKDVAEQILIAVDEIGVEKVLEIFFSPVKSTDLQAIQAHDANTQETIAKIEVIIGKESLNEITGYHRYLSTALPNNLLSASATKVFQIIGNLINNLEEWLNFGSAYESIDIDNQVSIILTQLEHWFDFVASGQMYVGLPSRYPGFDPDDDSNGGSGGGGQDLIYGGSVNNEQGEHAVIFFSGLNTTSTFES